MSPSPPRRGPGALPCTESPLPPTSRCIRGHSSWTKAAARRPQHKPRNWAIEEPVRRALGSFRLGFGGPIGCATRRLGWECLHLGEKQVCFQPVRILAGKVAVLVLDVLDPHSGLHQVGARLGVVVALSVFPYSHPSSERQRRALILFSKRPTVTQLLGHESSGCEILSGRGIGPAQITWAGAPG